MNRDKEEIEEGYKKYILGRPHVVILGAGATMAAIPNGDKHGKRCSVMQGFIDNLGLRDLLNSITLRTSSNNLEEIFSELKDRPECTEIALELENRIIDELSSLVIPDTPTIYDYLLLSLRSKDYIFTFNWDDLILQAYQRVCKITNDLPQLAFLHGNIGVGMCSDCGRIGAFRNKRCGNCHSELKRPKILFPVKHKDYASDPYIKNCWDAFLDVLSENSVLTIFGYSAPKSDVHAKNAMEKAFSSKFRKLDRIDVIDLKREDEIWDTWSDFARSTNGHLCVHNDIFDSILGNYPRRSIEGYWKQYFDGWWGKSAIQLKACSSFEELKSLFSPLLDNEKNGIYEVLS